ncbi:hypothetical protein QVD17_01909 [Tagetes erecta]|uniref:Uncharacterized protein n=1 Tax=Tagetes erecta TaxID=13708 RepID=A0AAD8LAM8_TARER|nr:hypothetical protein QVD17_01909 [Tagetes erecta]
MDPKFGTAKVFQHSFSPPKLKIPHQSTLSFVQLFIRQTPQRACNLCAKPSSSLAFCRKPSPQPAATSRNHHHHHRSLHHLPKIVTTAIATIELISGEFWIQYTFPPPSLVCNPPTALAEESNKAHDTKTSCEKQTLSVHSNGYETTWFLNNT